ncbi:MAG: ABC transporter substrate-binding protein, partial [Gemmatimonadaceae bacterium]|nr:ABC transporter substrate-binding protein [Acetobacteraceae bacterium]
MTIHAPRRVFLAGSAATLAATAWPARAQPAKTAISVRVDRDFEVLDPAFRTGLQDGNVVRAITQRLITVAPGGGALTLDAAEEVKQVSPTVIEFRLKPGQMFTDGFGEMTADDVKFSYERFVIPVDGKESPYKGEWANLKAVEVTGRLTGRVVLDKPRAGLFTIAFGDVAGSILCRRAVEQRGAEHNTKPVGSGPLMVTSFEKQRQVVMRRNPAYVGERSGFDEVAVRYVPDPRTTELGLRSGDLDFAALPPSVAEPLRTAANLRILQQPGIANVWLGMNTEKPPFNDVRVRRAIRLALDVDQMLLGGYNGRAPRANALVMPQVVGHWAEAPVLKRDVAQAKRLMAEAGHASGFRARILVQNQPVYQTMALVARAMLAEIGITLEVDAQDAGSFFSAGKGDVGKALDMFIIRFNGKLDPNFLAQWFTSDQVGVWNWQRWANKDFDALLDQGSSELDDTKRAALFVRAQQIMEESAAFVWLTYDV